MIVGTISLYFFTQSLLQSVTSIHVLMEAPVHNMGIKLPALAQWDILEICVKVYTCYMYFCVYMKIFLLQDIQRCLPSNHDIGFFKQPENHLQQCNPLLSHRLYLYVRR